MKLYLLRYIRHGSKHWCWIYAPSEAYLLDFFPDDLVTVSLIAIWAPIDYICRFFQRNFILARVKNRQVMSLFDLMLNSLTNKSWELNQLLKESILSGHPMYLQHEYCQLYFKLESGNNMSYALTQFRGIPSHILTLIRFVEKGVDFTFILRHCISFFEMGVKRNYSYARYAHFAAVFLVIELVYATFVAENELKDYFYYFRMTAHEPSFVSQWYYDLFRQYEPVEIFQGFFNLYVGLFLIRFMYSAIGFFRYIMDWVKLHLPIYRTIEFLRCQMYVYHSLTLADETMMTYADSLDLVGRQIDNTFLFKQWAKIRKEYESYSTPIYEMVNILFSKGKTMARLSQGRQNVGKSDVELIDLDLKHKVFTKDMIVFIFAMILVVGLPIWTMVAISVTQYEFWMLRLRM